MSLPLLLGELVPGVKATLPSWIWRGGGPVTGALLGPSEEPAEGPAGVGTGLAVATPTLLPPSAPVTAARLGGLPKGLRVYVHQLQSPLLPEFERGRALEELAGLPPPLVKNLYFPGLNT